MKEVRGYIPNAKELEAPKRHVVKQYFDGCRAVTKVAQCLPTTFRCLKQESAHNSTRAIDASDTLLCLSFPTSP
jgi:hypothetical protein